MKKAMVLFTALILVVSIGFGLFIGLTVNQVPQNQPEYKENPEKPTRTENPKSTRTPMPETPYTHPNDTNQQNVTFNYTFNNEEINNTLNVPKIEQYVLKEINDIRTGNLSKAERQEYHVNMTNPESIDRTYTANKSYNLSKFKHREWLASAGRAKSRHMYENDYFSHNGPNGNMDASKFANETYPGDLDCYHVELIAATSPEDTEKATAKNVVDAWMYSYPHRMSLLAEYPASNGYVPAGVGVYIGTRVNGPPVVYSTLTLCDK
jgi:uncharacterized protein YkwD